MVTRLWPAYEQDYGEVEDGYDDPYPANGHTATAVLQPAGPARQRPPTQNHIPPFAATVTDTAGTLHHFVAIHTNFEVTEGGFSPPQAAGFEPVR
jgi:hypothetical protein